MAKGSSRTSRAQLLGGFLASGVVAPLVVVAPFGLQAQAQEQEQPSAPSSEQVDAPGTTQAEPAAEPQVLRNPPRSPLGEDEAPIPCEESFARNSRTGCRTRTRLVAEARRHSPDRPNMQGLILAQNERWRRGLGMQVERERGLRLPSRAAKG